MPRRTVKKTHYSGGTLNSFIGLSGSPLRSSGKKNVPSIENLGVIPESPFKISPYKSQATKNKRKFGTVKLNLEEIENQERENMKMFIRSAKRHGTKLALHKYLVANAQEIEAPDSAFSYRRGNSVHGVAELYHDDDEDYEYFETSEEEEDEFKTAKWVINPDGRPKKVWDHIQMMLIIYIATAFPFKLSYIEDGSYPMWDKAEYFVDFLFFMDMFITFFVPVFIKFKITYDHKQIAWKYIRFWFWVDLISVFPFDLLIKEEGATYEFAVKLLKTPRLYKIFRLMKMFRTFKASTKNDTAITELVRHVSKSEVLLISIAPIYLFGIIVAHIFACIWHYNSTGTGDPRNWLLRYNYDVEPIHDKFWASLYFVYATVTTTGYGDIVPDTTQEFVETIIFMVFGVVFYSFVYTTIMGKFEDRRLKNERFHTKIDLMRELKKDKCFSGRDELYKEMLFVIEEHKDLGLKEDSVPDFINVRPHDRTKLLIEVCERKYKFNKIPFFVELPKFMWLFFFENMQKRVYIKGDIIFERGSISSHFFVIRTGSAWFMMNDDRYKGFAFMETKSYFGEFEIFDEKPRRWTIQAKDKVVVYALARNEFLKMFMDERMRTPFIEQMDKRIKVMEAAERECGRVLRRTGRVKEKIKKMMEKNSKSIQKSIRESKKIGGKVWHNAMYEVADEFHNKKLEKQREQNTKKVLEKLEEAKKKGSSGDTDALKSLFGGANSKALLGMRRSRGKNQPDLNSRGRIKKMIVKKKRKKEDKTKAVIDRKSEKTIAKKVTFSEDTPMLPDKQRRFDFDG